MSLNCVWSETSLEADNRSHYALATLVNNALDRAELGFVHRNGFKQLPPDADGAVVVIHGGHQVTTAEEVIRDVQKLQWAVVIVIGDEMAQFPVERLSGPRRRVWVQMAVPGKHDFASRKLICGYPHDTQIYLTTRCVEELQKKPLNWFYAGQVNHLNRRLCVEALKAMNRTQAFNQGTLVETPGFWQGLSRDDYYKGLASCKVAPCPTGAATPDTLRMAEALEAGCVPIVEDKWPPGFPRNRQAGMTGYWRYVLGYEPPFPTLVHWSDFPAIYEQVMRTWPTCRDNVQTWWQNYKQQHWEWLREDVNAVR